ncbi:MAG: universal stress protein [Bacteroidales bacterium]|nr:universal stress protein [Bacteroidales bacterium]
MDYSDLILVTWDFTDKSYMALEHAISIARRIKHDIAIIHIVKKETDIPVAERQIHDAVRKSFENLQIKPQIFVKEGTIFNTIAEMTEEIKARMVVMGTHGMKGMQKILGSWALKVIAGSKSPFIVVQDKPQGELFFKIFFYL